MQISFLCSDDRHPVFPHIAAWRDTNISDHEISIVRNKADLVGGEILFLISCAEIVKPVDRSKFQHCFVIHASDLPQRRGWSPHIWAILEGEAEIVVSLLAAADPVDSGDVYAQRRFGVRQDQLLSEINEALFRAEFELVDWAVKNFGAYCPKPQIGEPTYCERRTPEDSRILPEKSILEQFDILRLADPVRFPAFFDYLGQRYQLTLSKFNKQGDNTQ